EAALPALREAAATEQGEIRARAEELVRRIELRLFGTVHMLKGHTSVVVSVAFFPDGRRALTAGGGATPRIWGVEKGRQRKLVETDGHPISSLALSPDGKYAMTGGWNGNMRLWYAETGRPLRPFLGHTKAVRSVAFSRSGRRVLSAGSDMTVRLWEVATGK